MTVPRRALPPSADGAWIGRVIGGKYAVEGILGRGGMGLVLKARHLRLDEAVAIKVLHGPLAADPSMAARMLREARVALRLSSEHVVRVMDVDTLENGVPFIVLEYLEGEDVASFARKRGSVLPWEQAVAILEQACRALVEAHALGIVHRDLKPANLFIVERPDGRRVVKLLDFGISKLAIPREAPITRDGDVLGSPRYMSPEQVKGGTLDGRSDLWAVGVVLYELITGTAPFAGSSLAVACQRVLEETPAPLRSLRPEVPAGLVAVIERCLEKDRERRFPDAAALHEALAPFGRVGQRGGSQAALPGMELLSSAPSPASGSPASGSPAGAGVATTLSPSSSTASSWLSPSPTLPGEAISESTTVSERVGARVEEPLAEEPLADATTAILGGGRTRRLRWLALAGLALGVMVGVALLARGRGHERRRPAAASRHPAEVAPAAPSGAAVPSVLAPR